MNRRRFLLATSSCLAMPAFDAAAQSTRAADVGPREFIELSRVLTETVELDAALGRQGLAALRNDPVRARLLPELWAAARFDSATPPVSVDDLVARGVYARPPLADLCDAIAHVWYSGIYVDSSGGRRIVTYTDALAWRALGYRPAGPTACGGVFGHWAGAPAGR
jgi:hypothetical protein